MRSRPRLGLPLLVMLGVCSCKRTPELDAPPRQRGPEPTTAAMTAPPAPVPSGATCVLSIPNNRAEVTLFPTEAGLREFTSAARGGNDFEMATVMQKHHAILVDTKTTCERVAVGPDGIQVRVSSGAQSGKTGWVASDWTVGN